ADSASRDRFRGSPSPTFDAVLQVSSSLAPYAEPTWRAVVGIGLPGHQPSDAWTSNLALERESHPACFEGGWPRNRSASAQREILGGLHHRLLPCGSRRHLRRL